MELRVQLKVCEGCGCLWYRPQPIRSSYCRECIIRLKDFAISTRRPSRFVPNQPVHSCQAAQMSGGAQ
jgi:hypothetical protein